MTYAEAVDRYRRGDYVMSAPPVCFQMWTEADWVFYIFGVRP